METDCGERQVQNPFYELGGKPLTLFAALECSQAWECRLGWNWVLVEHDVGGLSDGKGVRICLWHYQPVPDKHCQHGLSLGMDSSSVRK